MSACRFSFGYLATSLVGFALFFVAAHLYGQHRREAPPVFEFNGASLVSLRAANGRYVQVSAEDGVLRATALTDKDITTRFRVHVLSAATVAALQLASASVTPWAESTGGMVSASQCRCSGVSNEHGFGRHCHPWEDPLQEAWCYVGKECKSGIAGSFGRRHDVCSVLNRFGPADGVSTPADDGSRQGDLSTEAQAPPVDTDLTNSDTSSAELRYVPPTGCPCSGVKSALGFGARCQGWEYEGQTPWCYVFDNCSLASAAGRAGSFGHRYLDCVLEGGAGRRLQQRQQQRQRQPRSLAEGGAVTSARGWGASLSAVAPQSEQSFPRRAPDEDALLEKVERLRQPHVALVSVATEGFVSVEMPPHRLAMRPHARTDALSLHGVFSFLSSGAVMALGTNALLNLCAPLPGADGGAAGGGATDGGDSDVCTSFVAPGSAHPKLLRTSTPKSSRFVVKSH